MDTLVGLSVAVLFFLPIYLPFLLSFLGRSPKYREVRIALRMGSVMAFIVTLIGAASRKDYGNDAAGNMASAIDNFRWVWGGGLLCVVTALLIGLAARSVRIRKAKQTGLSNG